MKQFINKEQMNNYIFLAIVELIVLFMFKNAISTDNIMANTFSIIVIVVFVIPVVLSYFSTDILPIFNNMLIPRFQTKKRLFYFIIVKTIFDSFKIVCILLVPIHIITTFVYRIHFFELTRYYFSFFMVIMLIFIVFMIVYFKVRNKNVAIIITYCLSNVMNLLSSLFREKSIPNLVEVMHLEYENKVFLIVFILLLIVTLMVILYKIVSRFEMVGETKNVL